MRVFNFFFSFFTPLDDIYIQDIYSPSPTLLLRTTLVCGHDYVAYVLCCYSDRDTQLQRLMERNNFTQSDAELRINAQMSLDEKCKRASYIINNSSNRETTEKQAKRLYETFTRSFAYLPLRVFVLFVLLLIAWLLICLMRLISW